MKKKQHLFVLTLLTLLSVVTSAFGEYSYQAEWGSQGVGPGDFISPRDIAIDFLGSIYVSDNDNNRIQKFSNTYDYITEWTCNDPMGIAVDESGNVYVADAGGNRIHKFGSNNGLNYNEIDSWFASHPIGVTVSPSGSIFVTEETTDTITKFSDEGTVVTFWGGAGNSEGQFNTPTYIAVDSSNYVYVADYGNNRIQKFNENGDFINSWYDCNHPQGVAVDSLDNIYVAAYNDNVIKKFTNTGFFLEQWGESGTGQGEFTNPIGVEIDSSGKVFVADHGYHRIQVFVPETSSIQVSIDIKPGSCLNPLNVKSKGVLTVAILGTDTFDVSDIDIASVWLEGVAPIRSSIEDISVSLANPYESECPTEGPEGYNDLTLKFETQSIIEVLGDLNDGEVWELYLDGVMKDGTPIEGSDYVLIRGKAKSLHGADVNNDGVVNTIDFSIFADNWLQSKEG